MPQRQHEQRDIGGVVTAFGSYSDGVVVPRHSHGLEFPLASCARRAAACGGCSAPFWCETRWVRGVFRPFSLHNVECAVLPAATRAGPAPDLEIIRVRDQISHRGRARQVRRWRSILNMEARERKSPVVASDFADHVAHVPHIVCANPAVKPIGACVCGHAAETGSAPSRFPRAPPAHRPRGAPQWPERCRWWGPRRCREARRPRRGRLRC